MDATLIVIDRDAEHARAQALVMASDKPDDVARLEAQAPRALRHTADVLLPPVKAAKRQSEGGAEIVV